MMSVKYNRLSNLSDGYKMHLADILFVSDGFLLYLLVQGNRR